VAAGKSWMPAFAGMTGDSKKFFAPLFFKKAAA
jgi:hypothetical protein